MTTPNVTQKRLGGDDETLTEWAMRRRRELTWAAVAVAVIVAGAWYYARSQAIKAQRAETAYFQARQAGAAGNLPLAVSDLQKVVSRYEGTRAGTQAALSLTRVFYEQKKYKEGIDVLKKAELKATDDFKPSIHALEAAGYEELKDLTASAQQYEQAAKATRFPAEKTEYKASAARTYMAAGKTIEAKAIWTELAKDETGPVAAEAKVRLGELDAKPMKI